MSAAAGVGQHLLVMAQDEVSCAMLWDSGVPCWVDTYCPRGEALPEGAPGRCVPCWRPRKEPPADGPCGAQASTGKPGITGEPCAARIDCA